MKVMCLTRRKKGKCKVLSRGFCISDSEAEQRALQFLHIHCSSVNSYSSAPESNRQNQPNRTMDVLFFFQYIHITSRKNVPSPDQARVCRSGFRATLCAVFVLSYWLRKFLLSTLANRIELRCEPKRLMLLNYKICPLGYSSIILLQIIPKQLPKSLEAANVRYTKLKMPFKGRRTSKIQEDTDKTSCKTFCALFSRL